MSVRAGIVVTGTEVLTGRVQDRNGPWLAERLLELGVDLAHTMICGDRPEDMRAQLRFLAGEGVDLVVTSGIVNPCASAPSTRRTSSMPAVMFPHWSLPPNCSVTPSRRRSSRKSLVFFRMLVL